MQDLKEDSTYTLSMRESNVIYTYWVDIMKGMSKFNRGKNYERQHFTYFCTIILYLEKNKREFEELY